MTLNAWTKCSLFAAVAAVTLSSSAHANDTRYVSMTGKDANACTLAAPCRSLQRGINVTPSDGELRVLDSGFYGSTATISKSITISSDHATLHLTSIVISRGDAIFVDLRGLDLNGAGPGTETDGVIVASANSVVNIDDCVIHRFYNGILVTGGARVSVTDSVSRDNRATGLYIRNVPGARLTVDNSRFQDNNSHGVVVYGGTATITRSIVSGMTNSGGTGITAVGAVLNVTATTSTNNQYGFALETSKMTLDSATVWGNSGYGLMLGDGSTVQLSNSTFTNNGTGIEVFGRGKVLTRGNNTVSGNKKDVDGALTPLGGV
jgi:hypothetical protein